MEYWLGKIIDTLVGAGYFRARLKALDTFDRVVGGIVWCVSQAAITYPDTAIDVDIIFVENASIGAKIKISDEIVAALKSLGMPYQLQSHQIQGMDFPSLFPVIQWLVKLVLRTRQATAQFNRLISITQLVNHSESQQGIYAPAFSQKSITYYHHIGNSFELNRIYRKQPNVTFSSKHAQVQTTLLEYGDKIVAAIHPVSQASESKTARSNRGSWQHSSDIKEAKIQADEEESKKLEELQKSLSSDTFASETTVVDVGRIMSSQLVSIQELDRAFSSEIAMSGLKMDSQVIVNETQAHKRKMENLQKQLSEETSKFESLETARKAAILTLQAERNKLEEILKKNAELVKKNELLEQRLNLEERNKNSKWNQLKALIKLNENLKSQEKQFKASCRAKLQELEETVRVLEGKSSDMDRMNEVERTYNEEISKYQEVREALAKKNLVISQVSRKIDEMPSKDELLQYERRFSELHELVASKFQENKKVIEHYNVLEKTYTFLQRETSLLNSIKDAIPEAIKTPQSRENFLNTLQTKIVDGVVESKVRLLKELTAEKQTFDQSKIKYSQMLDLERQYFKAVKDLQDECVKNEKLMSLIELKQ